MKHHIIFNVVFLCFLSFISQSLAEDKKYVGAEACKACHEKEYSNYLNFAKKVKSFESIKKMEKKLTLEEYQACFECHTTGYGKPGGFESEEKTPGLKNAGCEVCHGPGSQHIDGGDPEMIIRDVTLENCNTCHSKDRIEAFDFKPLLFGGAH
ncbi:MAG: cytochrome C [Desulfobacterales bacterium RIFOXYA12_FULL_46_15]|nr:MAG: cytochrome C [Desulfobacterales bacterium RIFOXYA12_FULL_46_15]